MQGVTLGVIEPDGERPDPKGSPQLGRNILVGAGANVLGRITVGDGARIGANAVVLCDVPDGATAVGVPARILERRRTGAGS